MMTRHTYDDRGALGDVNALAALPCPEVGASSGWTQQTAAAVRSFDEWLSLAGLQASPTSLATLPDRSCIFASPTRNPLEISAGPGHVETSASRILEPCEWAFPMPASFTGHHPNDTPVQEEPDWQACVMNHAANNLAASRPQWTTQRPLGPAAPPATQHVNASTRYHILDAFYAMPCDAPLEISDLHMCPDRFALPEASTRSSLYEAESAWRAMRNENMGIFGSGLIDPQQVFQEPSAAHSTYANGSEVLSLSTSPEGHVLPSSPQSLNTMPSLRLWQDAAFFRLRPVSQQAEVEVAHRNDGETGRLNSLSSNSGGSPKETEQNSDASDLDLYHDAAPSMDQQPGDVEDGQHGSRGGSVMVDSTEPSCQEVKAAMVIDLDAAGGHSRLLDAAETEADPGQASPQTAVKDEDLCMEDAVSSADALAESVEVESEGAAARSKKQRRKKGLFGSKKRMKKGAAKKALGKNLKKEVREAAVSSIETSKGLEADEDGEPSVANGDAFPRLRQMYLTRHRRGLLSRVERRDGEDESAAVILMHLSHMSDTGTSRDGDASSDPMYRDKGADEFEGAFGGRSEQQARRKVEGGDVLQDSIRSGEAADTQGWWAAADVECASLAMSSAAEAAAGSSRAAAPIRSFPPDFPIHKGFWRFYQRYKVPSSLPDDIRERLLTGADEDAELKEVVKRARKQFAPFNSPRSLLDLYTPRFCKGVGMAKEGLCPLCYEDGTVKFFKTKISAYNYHMQYAHGISAATGLPFTPPIAFQMRERPNAATREKTEILQGKCHVCKKYVDVEGTKIGTVKVPEIYWWKHAQTCHRLASPPDGLGGFFVEDALYSRVKAWMDRQSGDANA
ncbi:hypothetical protein ACQY0O_008091 [Thecaphora frezii]